MSKSKDKKNNDNELLSFEELKNKVNHETAKDEKPDSEINDLLSALGDESKDKSQPEPNNAQPAETEQSRTEKAEPQNLNAESTDESEKKNEVIDKNTDRIYNDILSAINDNSQNETEQTSRRNKYSGDDNHFIDITNQYQKPREEEKAPAESIAIVRPSKDKKPEEKPEEKPEDEQKEEKPEEDEKPVKTFGEMFKSGLAAFFPNKHDKVSEIIRKVIMDVSVFTLIGCAVWFGVLMGQKNSANKQNANIKGQVIDADSNLTDEEAWAEFFAKYPNVTLPQGMMPKYAYLYAINNDLVGWIRVPNTAIDVQVVQAEDNDEYLKQDFYGNYSRYGCPFLDFRCDPKYLSQNTVIYGHHMSDGLVFAELDKYKKPDGFKESPIIEYDTLFKTYKFKIYAAFIAGSAPEQDNGYLFYYNTPKFPTKENFDAFIAAIDERKLYSTGVSVDYTDKLITLSTCSYEFSNARLVVIGRLLRDGESENVDTSLVTVNENPRYPQVWYDKKGQKNPFASAEKWQPAE